VTESGLDVGLLLLRVVTGALLVGHAMLKLRGWFSGPGLAQATLMFESWGFRPAKASAILAGVGELVGGIGLLLGLFLPVVSAVVVGTMVVGRVVTSTNGLWAARSGCELPLFYGVIGAALAFTGSDRFSLDDGLGLESLHGASWGIAAVLVGVVAAAPSLLRRQTALKKLQPE
jgi:putative oxidoreductase